jgi:putative hydrolase of the HAD superfamily
VGGVIPPGALRGVLLDYGNVIGAVDYATIAADVREAGGEGDLEATLAVEPAAYRAHDRAMYGGAGHAQAWDVMLRTFVDAAWGSAPGGTEERAAVVAQLWRRQPERNLWRRILPEARDLIGDLNAAGVPLGIVSNSEGRMRELLTEMELADSFAVIVDSGAAGVSKPDPAIFRLAAEELGLPLGELVHVGDSEAADVAGALAAGAYAIRFDGVVHNPEATAADARAESYAELREILARGLGIVL